MSCSKYRMLINEYVDGEISREDEVRLFYHLSTCSSCNIYLSGIRELKGKIRKVSFPEPDESLEYLVLSKTGFRRVVPVSSLFRDLGFDFLKGFFRDHLRNMAIGFPIALLLFVLIFSLFSQVPSSLEGIMRNKFPVNTESEEVNSMIYNVLYLERTYQFTPEGLGVDDTYIPRISSIPLKKFAEEHIKDPDIGEIELIATITRDGNAKVDEILQSCSPQVRQELMNLLNYTLVIPAISDGKRVDSKIAIKFEKVVVTG